MGNKAGFFAYNSDELEDVTLGVAGGNFNFWTYLRGKGTSPEIDTIKVGEPQAFGPYNILAADGPTFTIWVNNLLVFDQLVKPSPKGEVTLWMAESIDIVDDTTIDVTLRPDLMFHDGVKVTADDVAFSYMFLKEWKPGYFLDYLEPIVEVEVLDELTARFTLVEPYAPLLLNTFGNVPILPKHIWEDVVEREGLSDPDEWTSLDSCIGSGPFKMVHWRHEDEILIERNEDYFDPPNFKYATFTYFTSKDALFEAFRARDINLHEREGLTSIQLQEVIDLDYITVQAGSTISFHHIQFQMGWLPCSDPNFRKAMSYTVDMDTIVNSILLGYGSRGLGLITPGNEFWHNPKMADLYPSYDIEEARKILEEAGYEWDEEGNLCFPPEYTGDPYAPPTW
jgi:peptide/nickel transport system substrate-binding protein